jgi:ribosomal protein S18 acetylase RimI-like enzyme
VRRATPEDSERVAELNWDLDFYHVSYHPIYHVKENASVTRAYIKDRIEKSMSGDGLVLVAQDKDIVGFLSCSILDRSNPNWEIRKIGHIGPVYVIPEYRRRGTGRALIKEALKWMKTHEVEYVELNVVAQNSAGAAAWKALGFEPVSYNLIQKM